MRLRIWHKMIIGISIPSCIVLIGGLLTYGYINDVESRQEFVQIADDLKERVLELRRNEKNFFLFKNDASLDNLRSAIQGFANAVSRMSSKTALEIGRDEFSILQDSIRDYPDHAGHLYDNYQQEYEDVERVRENGRKLEAFIKTGRHAKELTTNFVLHVRLLEKNYMLFRDNDSFNELNKGLGQLINVMPFCIECTPYIEAVHNLFETYRRSDLLVKELQFTGNRLEEVTGKIALRERERISSFLNKTKKLLFLALVLICILGPLFVYKTASYIVAPIKRLARITRKIADGDLSLRAPLRELDETADLSQSFNTMLDQLQLTHQSLEKSMALVSEKQAQLVESEKRASLGLLVSGVAHELNNPLNNISLIAERIYEEKGELSREEMRDFKNIIIQCERAKIIVDNLLDFARARKSTVMEKQDIINVVKEAFTFVGNQLKLNHINLVQDIPDKSIFINGNHSKLEQILVSIFTNAIQAMNSGGTLTISIKVDAENREVLLRFTDTGPGIPEEDMKNVFEPFFTTKPVGQGTGLGLSVCRSLVMEHRGQIDVESSPGKGTTFIIKFPLYEHEHPVL